MRAEDERIMDEYERMAVQAMMIEKARREARPKLSDLFERPKSAERKTNEEKRKESEKMNEWLSRLTVVRKG